MKTGNSLARLHLASRSGVIAAAVFQLCVAAHAQTVAQLSETVVTATRVAQPLSDLVADVTVIDRDTIERSGVSGVADLLARQPGIEFTRNGGPGSTTSVFVRGGETRFTAVFIDGVRVDSQSTGGASWQSLSLAQIDRIEILRGPAAAVYGSDAIAGVIQIFTRKGEAGFAPYVGVGVGTYSTRKYEGGFSGATGGFDYSLGLSREESDGYNARPVAGQNPDKDGFKNDSINARVGLQINKQQRVEASYLHTDVNAQYDSGLTGDARSLSKIETIGLNWNSQWTDIWSTKIGVSDSHDKYETIPSPYLTDTNIRGYLFQNEFRMGQHLVTAALERREDHLTNAPINRDRSQDAIALGYGWTNKVHTVQANVRHDDDSEFGGKNTGSLAYGLAITPAWRVTASTGTAFRAPTLYQRFSEYGVSTLQPETSRNKEIGLRFAEGGSTFDVVAYKNKVSNLITFATPGPCASTFGCYANTARAEYTGVTFSGTQKLGAVNLRGSLDLQDPIDLTTNRRLARRSGKHGTLGADYRIADWTLGAEAQFSGPRPDSAVAKPVILGGYTLISLSASTAFARDWTFIARVDNLADKDYRLINGYATAGRTLWASVKWAPK